MSVSDYNGLRRWSGIVETGAECRDCGWSASTHHTSVMLAARHAKATGHIVTAHQINVTTFAPEGTPLEDMKAP